MRLEPDIQSRVIGMQLAASQLYWKWVAAGQVVRTQERLLELARRRNENLIKQVEEGDLPKITEIDNGRFIAKRQVKLVESRRKVQEAAIKLSLFLRDSTGQPVVVSDDRLPCDFPTPEFIDPAAVESDIVAALSQRPELIELDFQRQQVEVELCYARNQTLPKLDAYAEAGQDVGEPTSSKRDKSELELEFGLLAEVPLQRRAACGKIQAAQGKLAQIAAKRRFTEDKIRSQVQDAVSALRNAYERIQFSKLVKICD
jgi:outer membrane protein TolC